MLKVREERRELEMPGGDVGTVVLSAFPQLQLLDFAGRQTPSGTRVCTRIRRGPSTDPVQENHLAIPPSRKSPVCGVNEGSTDICFLSNFQE